MTEKTRRNPKQARAQATVDAILAATFQLLESEGESRLTTNRIAERAGVSIGTLYQYFRDRDDILAAMGERQAEALRQKVTEIVLAAPEQDAIRTIIQAIMGGIEGSPETRIVLMDALFKARGESIMSEHHLAFVEAISSRSDLNLVLGRESAFVLTHAVICLLRAAAAEPELELDPKALEDELVLLIESYLIALGARAEKASSKT
ncbi:TetR family transcriptional regulator [Hyphomonas sp. CACIAM 19H1]|uniref:TetR/AcrR family transcriptional regulator n=1 Tax=Hyphomonas sp. CACIAM 19H1 TaxID=1873716 RepID=UPI000DED9660|nr:TetR/AcrR family transcriptional regulator [Hyphomonas sp. CACIAM 19H1]AXE63201.1 TetR family transcriptional regulator [Hyphomonas sp. CACIAM 19H1]